MTIRKFYRTVIQVEILSEEPYHLGSKDLDDIRFDIIEGDCSGAITDIVINEQLDGKQVALALQNQGSDPEFFQIDEEGNDIND